MSLVATNNGRSEMPDSQEVTKVATVEVAITPMQMLATAVEQNADLDKLTKLMDLQERWEANEARKAFIVAYTAFKAEPVKILKNQGVHFNQTSYDHATLDNVADILGPALSKHGLSYSWKPGQEDGGLISVTCVLTHVQGHSKDVTLRAGPDKSGAKNSIQAVGSTVTYLQRYTLLAATGMATGGQDADANINGTPISAEQKNELVTLLRSTESDTTAFLKYLGVECLDVLPAAQFERAKYALGRKAQANGGEQ